MNAESSQEVSGDISGRRSQRVGRAVDARVTRRSREKGVCEVFLWRYAIPLFTVTYEPFWKGD